MSGVLGIVFQYLSEIVTPATVVYLLNKYFKLIDYLRAKAISVTGVTRKYNWSYRFWIDALGPFFHWEGERKKDAKVRFGDRVIFDRLNITEWVPLQPGFWLTSSARSLCNKYESITIPTPDFLKMSKADSDRLEKEIDEIVAKQYGTAKEVVVYPSYNLDKLEIVNLDSPRNAAIALLSGQGAVRLSEHDGYHLCSVCGGLRDEGGACSVDVGIPLLLSSRAYSKVERKLQEFGSVEACIEGIYCSVPQHVENLFPRSEMVPRGVIVIESPLLISDVQESKENILATAWTITRSGNQHLVHICGFDVRQEASLKEACQTIEEKAKHHLILTDFDEVIPRFGTALYTPSRMFATLDFRRILQQIRINLLSKT